MELPGSKFNKTQSPFLTEALWAHMCRKKSIQIGEVLEKGVSVPKVREIQIKTVIKFHHLLIDDGQSLKRGRKLVRG